MRKLILHLLILTILKYNSKADAMFALRETAFWFLHSSVVIPIKGRFTKKENKKNNNRLQVRFFLIQ